MHKCIIFVVIYELPVCSGQLKFTFTNLIPGRELLGIVACLTAKACEGVLRYADGYKVFQELIKGVIGITDNKDLLLRAVMDALR